MDQITSSSDFDPLSFVNNLLSTTTTTTTSPSPSTTQTPATTSSPTDEEISSTVRSSTQRLQGMTSEASSEIDRIMERLLSAAPRALQELDRLDRDASTLKHGLKRLEYIPQAGGPFQNLKDLDTIKRNLEKAIALMQEAAGWNGLVREMEGFFAAI
jgi:hypothetical protein